MKIIMVAIVYFLFIIIIFSLQLATTAVNAFAGTKTSVRRPATDLSAAVTSGDKVLVLGGTGGVGQLTIGKLLNHPYNLSVRTTSRDPTKAKETISIFGDATGDGDHKNLEIVKLDLLAEDTTALEIAMSDVAAVVISVGTTAFPTMKWKGGNTPKAIDQYAVERVARVAASKAPELKRIVLVTSVGVERTDQMPFVILNLFGVLDAKKKGEEAIMDAVTSKSGGRFDYVVIRPGRLVGGPYTNEDLAKLFRIDGGSGTTIETGDTSLGDCKRDGCADAVVQALLNDSCKNKVFSIMSTDENAWTQEEWKKAFDKL